MDKNMQEWAKTIIKDANNGVLGLKDGVSNAAYEGTQGSSSEKEAAERMARERLEKVWNEASGLDNKRAIKAVYFALTGKNEGVTEKKTVGQLLKEWNLVNEEPYGGGFEEQGALTSADQREIDKATRLVSKIKDSSSDWDVQQKDEIRINDIQTKSKGQLRMAQRYAENMANAVGSPEKAYRRMMAALSSECPCIAVPFARKIISLLS